MGKIKVLDKQVSELIAAGEVIERPASIMKEVLENAIDAKATAVTVEIKRGGISYLRITDNGTGISKEDLPTAFLRHATSKVEREADLERISTLGFRGEALASIAAVAKVEMISKPQGVPIGARVVLHGGEQISLEEAGCPDGTTLIVRDLFYNVPARLKFLKKDVTEGNAIQGIIEKLAVSHPEISFKFIRDNKTVLHTAGDNQLISAVYSVWGKEFASSLLETKYEYNGVKVEGFLSRPGFVRSNRAMQHFFVNNRYVRSRTCMASLEEGYKNAIMVGKFPACVLKISLDYRLVDVNVHPAKTEVRFVNEKNVFDAVYFAVKNVLSRENVLKNGVGETKKASVPVVSVEDMVRLSARGQSAGENGSLEGKGSSKERSPSSSGGAFSREKGSQDTFSRMNAPEFQKLFQQSGDFHSNLLSKDTPKSAKEESPSEDKVSSFSTQREEIPHPAQSRLSEPKRETLPEPERKMEENSSGEETVFEESGFTFLSSRSFLRREEDETKRESAQPVMEEVVSRISVRMIGELFSTYVLFQANDTFVMLDKHAAHERILFEKLKKQLDLKESQVLLSPQRLILSAEEYDVLEENLDRFAEYGFRFLSGDGVAQITEAPLILHRYDLSGVVQSMIESMAEGKQELAPEEFEDLLHSMACRAAIKANEKNSPKELEELVRQVYEEDITHCPHGRPVGITMSKYEIEKRFGRHQ